ncbi:MAG: sodium:solute symporter [Acidobacteria bacterium]|nr:sodium:solute symporter [Acidobacteriota bacterium]
MSRLDWGILVAYCGLLIAVGLYFHRRAACSVEGYFIADRNLPWWVIGLSDTAAYTGGGQAFLMVFFLGGFRGLWLMAWVSWVIWMPLVAVLWAKMWRRLGVVTSGEFIERRYGGRAARVYRNVFAVYACLAWGLVVLAYVAAWMAATLAPVLGWSNGQVLAVFGAVTLVYILLSGFFAVAYNDVIQFVLLMAGNSIFGLLLLRQAGGFETVWSKIAALSGEHFLDPLPWGGKLTAISVLALCVQGLFFAGSPYAGEGWTAQRYMAARSERHAVLGQMFNGFLALVVRLIPFVLIGLAAAALHAPESAAVPAQLWGELVRQDAPAGLFGLLLVGGLAGYMASISSMVNWAASYLMNDLYRLSLRPNASTKEYILVSRLCSAALLMAALAWGAVIDPADLDRWVLFINSALVVFPLPLAWLKWFWWRTNVFGEMVGTLGAFPAGYVVWFGSDRALPAGLRAWWRNLTGWSLDGLVPAFSNLDRYPFWAGFGILFGLGWASILLATLLTRPESMEVLRGFYRVVRPIGWWGPVRAGLPAAEVANVRAETARDMRACVCGILFYFAMTVSFFSLAGGRYLAAEAAVLLTLISGRSFLRSTLGKA